MTTPEGRVKDDVCTVLYDLGCIHAGSKENQWPYPVHGWYYMPVPNGLGIHGIPDFVGCYYALLFTVETKAPGFKPEDVTPNQRNRHNEILRAGGIVIVTSDAQDVKEILSGYRPK